jgi:hypothetical protein
MPDWPDDTIDFSAFGVLSTAGEGSQAADMVLASGPTFTASTPWVQANMAIYLPVVVRRQLTVYQLGWVNGSSVSGNIDVGIYDRNFNRLVSAGSTAQAGTNAIQLVDIADTTLTPGVYYLAMAMDNTSGGITMTGAGPTGSHYRSCGVAQQASAFPLPSAATFAAMAQNRVPLILGAIAGATF